MSESHQMLPQTSDKSAWSSIYIAGACSFIQSTQFAIFFASMWPYILTLQHDVKQSEFGVVVALYSFSQCVCSPLFGWWSNKIGQVRTPLIVGFCIMALGNIIYLSLQFFTSHHLYVMMAARFIAGAGTGNMSLLRAYVSTASSSKDRSRAIACVSGGIALGSMIGPGLQIIFAPLGASGISIFGFTINIYTSPALFCLILNIIGLLVVLFVFVETYIASEKPKSEVINGKEVKMQIASPDLIALLVIICTRYSQIFLSTTIESIGSAYSMMMFSFEKEEAVTVNAATHTVAGALAASLYVSFIFTNIRKYFKTRTFTVISLFLALLWFVASYPYSFYSNRVEISVNGSDAGCDIDKYDWCDDMKAVSPWVYYAGYVVIFGLVFSILNITATTLFSKVVGPRPQGTAQGVFQMAGSIGRLTAPLIMSSTYSMYGPVVPWNISIFIFSTIIALWIILRKRLIPFDKRQKILSKKEEVTMA